MNRKLNMGRHIDSNILPKNRDFKEWEASNGKLGPNIDVFETVALGKSGEYLRFY